MYRLWLKLCGRRNLAINKLLNRRKLRVFRQTEMGQKSYEKEENTQVTRMMFIKHYAPNRCLCIKVAKSTICNWSLGWGLQRMEVFVKMLKKGEKVRGEGGGCVQRMEVIVKRKKSQGGGGQGRCERRSGGGGWRQGGCELRSEAFVNIQKKKKFGGGGWVGGRGGRVGGGWGGSGWMWMEKWSFCENSKKKYFFFWGGVRSGGGGVRLGGGGGVRVDWNGELKLLWKFKKKKFFFLGGGGGGVGLGVRVDENGEVKFFENSKKKNLEGGGWVRVGGVGGGSDQGLEWGRWGVARFGLVGRCWVWGM